ncbi:MAG: tripartite tricarboxylate transporter TctB family protein [Halopseudomonas aestusnigri]
MTLTKEKAGALCFLVVAIAYGFMIGDIPSLPSDKFAPMTASTLPTALAWITGTLAFLLLIIPQRGETDDFLSVFKGLNWGRTFTLLALMVAYGASFNWLGFVLATIFFLTASVYVLGERRWRVILLTSIPVTLVFWFILTKLLEITLREGELYFAVIKLLGLN